MSNMGASKWLSVQTYSKDKALESCLEGLQWLSHSATTTDDVILQDFDVTQKFALAFGTELDGLSPEILAQADGFLKIPMVGFTESLNISVSAAITLFHLTNRMRSEIKNWQLTENEYIDLELKWIMSSVRKRRFPGKTVHKGYTQGWFVKMPDFYFCFAFDGICCNLA